MVESESLCREIGLEDQDSGPHFCLLQLLGWVCVLQLVLFSCSRPRLPPPASRLQPPASSLQQGETGLVGGAGCCAVGGRRKAGGRRREAGGGQAVALAMFLSASLDSRSLPVLCVLRPWADPAISRKLRGRQLDSPGPQGLASYCVSQLW
jgi:hypothetical protein